MSQKVKGKKLYVQTKHVTGFIQRKLDYFLVLNNLEESINKMDILIALSTDHLSILFLLSKTIDI